MRTARTLTVSPSTLCSRGGRTWSRGGGWCTCSWGGGVCSGGRRCGVPGLGGVSAPVGWCTWSCGGCVCSGGGVCLLGGGGVPGPGGCTWSGGVYLVRHSPNPPVDRMTHASENITLPQTSFAGGNQPSGLHSPTAHCQIGLHSIIWRHEFWDVNLSEYFCKTYFRYACLIVKRHIFCLCW